MKIAIIGSFNSKYPLIEGQIHAPLVFTFNIAKGLAKKGHEVTYFGQVGNDIEKVHNLSFVDMDYNPLPEEALTSAPEEIKTQIKLMYEQAYISKIFQFYQDFDLYYNWSAFRISSLAAQINKPIVVTHHDATNTGLYQALFNNFEANNLYLIPISNYMKNRLKMKNTLETVYNGIPIVDQVNCEPENYFCWLGRITPSKGLDVAINVCKKLNVKLKIAGPMQENLTEFGDLSQYIKGIKKQIEESLNIEYLGNLNNFESKKLIANAKALLFPSNGEESLPTVIIEAITQGTPAITSKKGPMPEMIEQGVSGFLCNSEEEYIEAASQIGQINRSECQKNAAAKFSYQSMINGYESRFEEVLAK